MRAWATTESLPLTLIFRSYVDCTVQAPSCSPVNHFLEINWKSPSWTHSVPCTAIPIIPTTKSTQQSEAVVTTSSALRLIKSQRQAMRRHFIFYLSNVRNSLYCSQLWHQLSLPVVINYVTTSLLAATPTKDWITASNSFSAAASARKRALLPQKVGSGYKDARKSFPSSAPSCCALKAFLPRTETLHQNSASYCRVRSFKRYFTSLGDSTEKLYCTHSSPATSQRPFLMPSSHGNNRMEHFDVAAAAPASHSESGTSPPGLAADEGRWPVVMPSATWGANQN